LLGHPFIAAWQQLQDSYAELYPHFPDVPLVRVKNINDPATIKVIEETSPDLILVSGTNLVGKKIIEIASRRSGVLNLHTGLSPYIKGGPNCTNWCLAERDFHLIGNTVMWLDAGIDSGNIIASEQTALSGSETLTELHWKVMEHAHAMCVCVVAKLASSESVPSVPQHSLGSGKTFYTADWNARAILRARHNFRRHYRSYFTDRDRQLAGSRTAVLPILEQS
jgi:methionyl-tRNA formyltransferase